MNMNMNNPSNNNALVVHSEDDKPSSSNSGVVLDALPYAEALDPNFENFAISLTTTFNGFKEYEQRIRVASRLIIYT